MDTYEHILDLVRRRKPIPSPIVTDALSTRYSEPDEQSRREVHNIVEAVRSVGAIVHNVDELEALGQNLLHASYYTAPDF